MKRTIIKLNSCYIDADFIAGVFEKQNAEFMILYKSGGTQTMTHGGDFEMCKREYEKVVNAITL